MKKAIALYLLVGLVFTPFIYFNNAEEYRGGRSPWGSALGHSFYWPSYLFSVEPVVDGTTATTFQSSIIEMIKYRNDKLFTGQRNKAHGLMVQKSIGNCMVQAGIDKNNVLDLYKKLLNGDEQEKEIERLSLSVIKQMDGYDFADIIEAGFECRDELEGSMQEIMDN